MEDLTIGAGFPARASNAASLPYAVRYRGWRLGLRMLGAGCGALLLAFLTYQVARGPEASGKALLLAIPGALTLLFVFQFWRLTKPQVILYPDRLEKPGVFQTQVLHRENIKGVGKTVYTRYGSYFEITSKSSAEPSVRLDGSLRKDPIVAEWLRGATDPKAEALKAERAEILADARYGGTVAERTRRLELAKQWTTAFNVACLALAAWVGFLAPLSPLTLLAVVAAPLLAAAWVQTSDDLIVWVGRPGRPRVIGALVPTVALAAHAGFTTHMLKPEPLGWIGALVGIAAAAKWYSARSTDAARLSGALGVGVATALTAYGVGVAIDVCLDRSPSKTFVAAVTDERIGHGRSTSYYLDLAPWSDRPASEVSVSSAFYDSTQIGSRVCLVRREGGLKLGWFDVTHCLAANMPVTAPPLLPTPSAPVSGVTNPDWLSLPDGAELAALYPDKAQRLAVQGTVTIHCAVQLDGSLTSCRVINESPQGYGFGAATLKAAARFRMRPATRHGRAVLGEITIPLSWRLR